MEDLRILETRHRSLDPQFVRGCVALPHGDHPVGPSFCSPGRLDGLHRPQGSLPAGPCPSRLSTLPSVCGSGQCLPVLCPLLRPLHGSTGLLTGMAPVPVILHSWGIHIRLVQSSSHESLLRDLRVVLDLCRELGIVVNPEKSHLVPSQVVQYLGVVIDSQSFQASPSPDRVARLRSTADAFLSCAAPPASTWLSLLGILSSLSHLVPGGRLRVRSLQHCLHRSWDRGDQSVGIPWSPDCLRDLQWWLDLHHLSHGVSLAQVPPDLDFWSDASDVGWGAHLSSLTASGLWDSDQASLSINARGLLAIREGLLHFQSSLVGKNVSVFCDNSTTVSYLRKEEGTRSPFLDSLAQEIFRWAESLSIRQLPQFIPGSLNVLVNSLSRPHQLPHTEWSLHPEVFRSYQSHVAGPNSLICNIRKSPTFSLFLSLPGSNGCGHRHLLPTLGQASGLRVSSVVCHSTGASEAPGVSGDGAHPDSSLLASARGFPDLLHLSLAPPVALPLRCDLLHLPQSHNLYQGLHRLHLHAWRLSGASRGLQVSCPL